MIFTEYEAAEAIGLSIHEFRRKVELGDFPAPEVRKTYELAAVARCLEILKVERGEPRPHGARTMFLEEALNVLDMSLQELAALVRVGALRECAPFVYAANEVEALRDRIESGEHPGGHHGELYN